MALAAPDYFAGANDPIKGAELLFVFAGWIRRRANEINNDTIVNVARLYDLAKNCFAFRAEVDKWRDGNGDIQQVRKQLIELTRAGGKNNSVKTDTEINDAYKALYQQCGTFLTFMTNNAAGAGQTVNNVTVTVNKIWPNPDFSISVPKAAAINSQINALLAIYD